ncbi:MAG: tRNA preQ1(34) S-adenosylmethionine ribosyltransferase-isomerase QueA [Lentisphaeria bacterium]|nr:tRNA preQ1(34) S-adenosylmethionine ribosyltransferase-isomerase QueA [Lentisphaeria bacterium]
MTALSASLFDYTLPEDLIAQRPADKRDGSRMMAFERISGKTEILAFPRTTDFLQPGDAMIFNDTRVLHGRMFARKNGDPAGAAFELLLVEELSPRRWKVLLKPGKRALPGVRGALLEADGSINTRGDLFTVIGRYEQEAFEVEFSGDVTEMQTRYGHVPLPPYIQRGDENADSERYQTIFAAKPGAVAAPTAGLHFTPEILQELENKGVRNAAVTLHVGPGTFKPVSVEDVTQHKMHSEEFFLPESTADLIEETHRNGHKVLAVGTTTVRVLESCVGADGKLNPGHGRTEIFLYPPYRPRVTDMLLTNFHLPKSTLLMLVSCYAERDTVLAAYQKAIENRMRFYSYGDCMLFY